MCLYFIDYLQKLKNLNIIAGFNSNSGFMRSRTQDQTYNEWMNSQEKWLGYDLGFIMTRSGNTNVDFKIASFKDTGTTQGMGL